MAPAHNILATPLFLNGPMGNLYTLVFSPTGDRKMKRKCIICVPSFAEEMNNCRRLSVLQARLLADTGFTVIIFDFYGTGDSSGDFRDATWKGWVQDLEFIIDWASERYSKSIFLWGIRTGCLIAAAQAHRSEIIGCLYWQPVLTGYKYLKDICRAGNISMSHLEKSILNGAVSFLEILGYEVNCEIIRQLFYEDIKKHDIPNNLQILWLCIVPLHGVGISEVQSGAMEYFKKRNVHIEICSIVGSPFWLVPTKNMPVSLAQESISFFQKYVCNK